MEGAAAKSHFPYSVCKKSCHLWLSSPLSSFQYPSSIQSLILTIFNSVLGPKKIIWISPANLGYILPATEFFAFMLDIQIGISWASDIVIKRFKSQNYSTCLRLQLWWKTRSQIKSFYRIESSSNLVGQKGSPGLNSKTDEYRESWYDWEYELRTKITKTRPKIEFFCTDSGQYPSRGRILCLHIRYSNENILSLWYRNQVIQKLKFIYASRNTTLMEESKWDKIFLQNRNW